MRVKLHQQRQVTFSRDIDQDKFDGSFHYRSIIGKLNYLENATRQDIVYALHPCARFCADPKVTHGKAILHLVKYLKAPRDKGITMDPTKDTGFEVYADADFSGNWNKGTAEFDSSTAKSRTGYVISFYGCPLIWTSKLQTQIALSTTEAEYIALSQALRDTIPVMNLTKELHERGIQGDYIIPKVYCKAFEDNMGAIELAKTPKMRPRTKHVNLVYHHFREHVREGLIDITNKTHAFGYVFGVVNIFRVY
jgi:hypothetical protein